DSQPVLRHRSRSGQCRRPDQARQGVAATNRNDEAEKHLVAACSEAATEKNPKLAAEACVQLGQIYLALGRVDEGVARYEQALKLDEANPEANNDLAWHLATRAKATPAEVDRAMTLARHACDLTTYADPAFISTLAAAHAAKGNFDQAEKVVE